MAHDAVDGVEVVGAQLEVSGGRDGCEVIGTAGADEGDIDGRVGERDKVAR